MALKARIKDEMKAALLSGDRFVGETLRNLTAATGPQVMGQVIGAVKKQVGNAADGAAIARIVKQKLN